MLTNFRSKEAGYNAVVTGTKP